MVFAYSRFYAAKRQLFIALAMTAGLVASMFRYEAVYLLALSSVLILAIEIHAKRWASVKIACVSGFLVIAALCAWSWERSQIMGDPTIFGSLHNFTGRQMFWRVYVSLGGAARSYAFSTPRDDAVDRWSPDHQTVLFVLPKNGPASAELATLSGCCAGPYPQYFAHPSDDLNWTIGEMVAQSKGRIEGDKFLRQVATEALLKYPKIFVLFAVQAVQYLGIDIRSPGLFTVWNYDTTQTTPFNIGGIAEKWLSRPLYDAYVKSYQSYEGRAPWVKELYHSGQVALNVVRNGIGIAVVLTIWFLPFTRSKLLATFLLISAGLLCAASTIGAGYSSLYEHMIVPYLLMLAAVSTEACVAVLTRRFKSLPSARPDHKAAELVK
jgi:hypothetical protein